MTTQDSSKRKKTPRKSTKKSETKLPENSEQANEVGNIGIPEEELNEIKASLAATQKEVERERQKRINAEKALNEAQESISSSQAEVEQERLTRLQAEQAKAEAEEALAEARQAIRAKAEQAEVSPHIFEQEGFEQRVTFVVRLTIDERGQPLRAEVEHAKSRRKQAFPDLDLQRVAEFMNTSIMSVVEPKSAVAEGIQEETAEEAHPQEDAKPSISVTVSEVKVFRKSASKISTLTINPNEDFLVEVNFRLEGTDAPSIVRQGSLYEIKVYANDITGGGSVMLASHQANLLKEIFEYKSQIMVNGLPPGPYRLVTLVTLNEPILIGSFYEGLFVRVAEIWQNIPDRIFGKN
jgi:hypothetical protein